MKISVVTTSRNSAATIGRTLESFAAQRHPERELIVIDGASTDGTQAIVQSFGSERVTLVSEPDDGIYDAMNKGLKSYGGDAVGFLNSDDRFKDEDVLSDIATSLAEADIVHGSVDFVARADRATIVRRWRGSSFRRRAFAAGWMPPHPTFYVRRNVVDAVGGFDVRYRIAADYDFMLRALEVHDFQSVLIDRVLVEMTHGGESTKGLKSYLISNYESYRSRRTWLDTGIVDPALISKPLRKVGQLIPRWTSP